MQSVDQKVFLLFLDNEKENLEMQIQEEDVIDEVYHIHDVMQ